MQSDGRRGAIISTILVTVLVFFLLSFWMHYPEIHPSQDSDLVGSFWPRIANSTASGGGVVPYIDYSLEYPAVSGWLLWAASSWPHGNVFTFYWTMSAFILAFMLVGVYVTRRIISMLGRPFTNAEYFIVFTPVFIYYSVYSFDWVGAAFLVLSIYLAYRGNAMLSGASMGLAIASRIIPVVCLPFILLKFRGRTDRAWFLGSVGIAWLVPNSYFMVRDFAGFLYAYTFQAGYYSEDSWLNAIPNVTVAKVVSGVLFLGVMLLLLRWRKRFDLSELCLLSLVGFLVTSYKFPPQYMILVLPLFAIVGRNYRLFMAVNILDVILILWYSTPMFSLGNPVSVASPVQWVAIARQVLLVIMLASVIRERLKQTKKPVGVTSPGSPAPNAPFIPMTREKRIGMSRIDEELNSFGPEKMRSHVLEPN